MPKINLSQYQFVLRDPWQAGHVMTELEATALNFYRADLIRKIAIRWIIEAEDACEDGVLTIPELELITKAIDKLDSEYTLSMREAPKLPAFNHTLMQIVLKSLNYKDLKEANIAAAMSDPANLEKAREQLIANLNSIYSGWDRIG
jgi:hypothetical protein